MHELAALNAENLIWIGHDLMDAKTRFITFLFVCSLGVNMKFTAVCYNNPKTSIVS